MQRLAKDPATLFSKPGFCNCQIIYEVKDLFNLGMTVVGLKHYPGLEYGIEAEQATKMVVSFFLCASNISLEPFLQMGDLLTLPETLPSGTVWDFKSSRTVDSLISSLAPSVF